MRQKLLELQGEINKSTIIIGFLQHPFFNNGKSVRTQLISSPINQLDIIDIYRLLLPTTVEYTFFSILQGTLTKINTASICGLKTYLNKLKKTETVKCMLSHHSGTEQEINNRKIAEKPQNTWRLNNTLLNVTQVKEISEILKYLKMNKNENTAYQNLWDTVKADLRRKFIALNIYIRKEEGFPGGAVVGSPPANAGDMDSCPGPGRSHMPRSN